MLSVPAALGVAATILWTVRPASAHDERRACRPPLYVIDLRPLDESAAGSGAATLQPAATPFGMALTPDGRIIYETSVAVHDLPPASQFGGSQYVAWATPPDLTGAVRLGVIGPDGTAKGQITLNKFHRAGHGQAPSPGGALVG
jgi:hypothetical protein